MRKDFRTAWLLLLLSQGPSYGYELRRALMDRELQLDPAVMYRSLRDMEAAGLIESRWMRSGAGPKRRVYDITDGGRAELARSAGRIRASRLAHSAFLTAYTKSRGAEPRKQRAKLRKREPAR
jgi:PadR family transcriptional regulator, regulatory protein PadR